jgi:hypothetical protein
MCATPVVRGGHLARLLGVGCLAAVVLLSPPLAAATDPLPDAALQALPEASPEVRQMARWIMASGDAGGRHVVLVDKRAAHAFVFDSRGRLQGHAPVLLGLARGDHTVPGIGDRPLAQVRPHERTTPAGRFSAELGHNLQGEDVVWVDYDAAVSMHRVRARVRAERRLERLASATAQDNRISYGCINVPVAFYERTLLPAVQSGALVYVLPEVRSLSEVFGPAVSQPAVPAAARPVGAAG